MFEWNLDGYQNSYRTPCMNCACIDCACTDCFPPGAYQVARGGSWSSEPPNLLSSNHTNTNANTNRLYGSPAHRFDYIGVRCARNP
jgi:formylglycine-generating enzyme required for sulfatase activity